MLSVEEYRVVLGTDDPDLAPFAIPAAKPSCGMAGRINSLLPRGPSTITCVQQQMGGAKKTAEFIRLFMAPGVMHCAGGVGPQPTGRLDALLAWVEEGKAPDTLLATRRDRGGAVTRSRPLCAYPLVAKYTVSGSTDDAANFVCSSAF